MPFPVYSLAETANGAVNEERLHREINALDIARFRYVDFDDVDTIRVVCTQPPPPARIAQIDSTVAAHNGLSRLDRAKLRRMSRFDRNTAGLLEEGFTYNAVRIGLQQNLVLVNAPGLQQLPLTIESTDSLATLTFTTGAALTAFVDAFNTAYRSIYDAGVALKDQVRAATTIDEVRAVIDDRTPSP